MSTKWTDNQLLAINARGGDVLVSAAAGSGKTAVLVERVLRMITDTENPVSIDRLLIVTYTRAAAAQLRERIGEKLTELITKYPDNRYYRRQLVLLNRANISTVDSFCSDICREFFHEIDIPREYKIAEDSELDVISKAALEETLNQLYEEDNSDFYELVKCFANSKSDNDIGENIKKLYKFLRSHPFMELWLDEKLAYYTDFKTCSDSVWGKVILKNARRIIGFGVELAHKTIEIAKSETEMFSMVSDLLYGDALYFEKLADSVDTLSWDELRELIYTFKSGKLAPKGYKDHPTKLKVADNRDTLKKCVGELKELFESDAERCTKDIEVLRPIVSQMFRCVRVYNDVYSKMKLEKNLADFQDIEHWALKLLVYHENGEYRFTDASTVISKRFDSVLVDEYQDANEVQDLIFRAVSKESNLFIVGDAKQSIYAFRQAMPEIFINRKDTLPFYDLEADNYPAKVLLEKNFRSRVEITDYVNFVFDRLMSRETGDISYKDGEGLVSGASYPFVNTPCAEFHLIDADSSDEDTDTITAEARHLAYIIRKTLSETKIQDKNGERSPNFGDIAILLRSGKKKISLYAKELLKYGIPSYFESQSSFFDLPEIKIALSLLRVIDNPSRDIPLMSAMISPVFGFTVDEAADIRAAFRKGTFYHAVLSYSESDKKCAEFLEAINELRTLAVTMMCEEFIYSLYERTGLMAIAACIGGEKAVSNLRLLAEYAAKFEKGFSKGVNAFVAYLDKLSENNCDLNASEGGEITDNAVSIMTVHASKGLEYPICILAGTHKNFLSDTSDNVLLDSHLGFAAKRRDRVKNANYNTFVRKALAIEKKHSEMSEELRVLYVALTRAKEKLFITAVKKNPAGYLSTLATKILDKDKISPYVVAGAKNICDWISLTSLMHKDGLNLRNIANAHDMDYSDNKSMLYANVYEVDDLSLADAEITREVGFDSANDEIDDIISKRFEYVYPESELCTLPLKVTASELSHNEVSNVFDRILKKPSFLRDKKLTPAEKGTAMHKFLQFADFSLARKDLEGEISRLNGLRLTDEETSSLDVSKLRSFIMSDIVTDAIDYESHREYRFTVNIPASHTGLCENSDASVILQGAVDLLIVKETGIIIVDYKTDRVKTTDELCDRYKLQLMLYKEAIEMCFDKPVSSCLIYSIHLGEYKEVL